MTVSKGPAGRVARGVAAVTAVSAVPVLYAVWIRRRLLTWGATRDEITRAWPGDELIPDSNTSDCTMATTLPAPPEQVWPWLVQMGVGRVAGALAHRQAGVRFVPGWRAAARIAPAIGVAGPRIGRERAPALASPRGRRGRPGGSAFSPVRRLPGRAG